MAIAVTAPYVKMKLRDMMAGSGNLGRTKGAVVKVVKIVPPTTYTAAGDALDLSALFPSRIYWLMFMNPTVRNATTGFAQVGYYPGTAKTDRFGGYSPTDGKVVYSAGNTESSGDMAAYVTYAVVCGC